MSAYFTEFMALIAQSATDPWTKQFAASIQKQARRPNWKPSEKQAAMMSKLIRNFEAGDEVIEPKGADQ